MSADPFAPKRIREARRDAHRQRIAVYVPAGREYRLRYFDGTVSAWRLATGKTLISAPADEGAIEWRTPTTGPKGWSVPKFLGLRLVTTKP